jgi:shikimate kinase
VLVGFMGAGKTTAGRLLAERLGWPFLDLDDRIRRRERREIAEIFRDSGEAYFRKVETGALAAVLRELGRKPGCVLALGGGAFAQPDNVQMLRAFGAPVVFLDASLDELRRRCEHAGERRPLFPDANLFRQLYEARREGYMTADVRVDTTAKSPAQVAAEVASWLAPAAKEFR